jgi:hypothetical protein
MAIASPLHFAVDDSKPPSNASKQWSDTHRELEEKQKRLEKYRRRDRMLS